MEPIKDVKHGLKILFIISKFCKNIAKYIIPNRPKIQIFDKSNNYAHCKFLDSSFPKSKF